MERTNDEEIHKRIHQLLRERTCVQMERSEDAMRSELSEFVRKTTGFFTNSWRIEIALESYFEEHAEEVWERNWMNPEMQTTLLNAHPPKLIATVLAVEEIAGPVPEIPLEYDQILKGGRFAPSHGAERSYRRLSKNTVEWRKMNKIFDEKECNWSCHAPKSGGRKNFGRLS